MSSRWWKSLSVFPSSFPSSKKLSIRKRAIVVDTFTRGLKMQGAGPSLSRKRKGWEKILRFNCKTERNNENIYIYEGRRIGTMERFAGKKSIASRGYRFQRASSPQKWAGFVVRVNRWENSWNRAPWRDPKTDTDLSLSGIYRLTTVPGCGARPQA